MPFSWVDQFFRQLAKQGSRSAKKHHRIARRKSNLHLETLESRDVPSAPVDVPDYVRLPNSASVTPFSNPGVGGFIPSQIAQAYGNNQVKFNGVQGDGTGTTIAIVDAYSSPTITTDLQAFDKEFNLPAPPSLQGGEPDGREHSSSSEPRLGWGKSPWMWSGLTRLLREQTFCLSRQTRLQIPIYTRLSVTLRSSRGSSLYR